MYQHKSLEDTIVAIATALGQGGIGIIRISGKQALPIADEIFAGKTKQKPSAFKSFTVHYGWILKKGHGARHASQEKEEIIDEVLLTVMRAPRSYTCEDLIEISCHGGTVAAKAILDLAVASGARLAEPGEFTKRAFLNGRIDLTQAEAVLDIIQSKTDAFLKVSSHQLKGELTTRLETIRAQLMKLYTEIEAVVNFPEDDIDAQSQERMSADLKGAKEEVSRLLSSGSQGRILKEGIKIVICGRPNVGKSSLLNVLLKQPRAIVSEIAGTTRDTIEETAQIKGIPFYLIDTAGILNPRDLIEEEAIKRSHLSIQGADLVLLVLDSSQPLSGDDKNLIEVIQGQNALIVLNKIDLPQKIHEGDVRKFFSGQKIIKISALQRTAVEDLENEIVHTVMKGNVGESSGILISNARHTEALQNCEACLTRGHEGMKAKISLEFISEEIKAAVNFLDNITGRNIDEDLLDTIFSKFCIGK